MFALKPISLRAQKSAQFQEIGSIGVDFTEDKVNLVQFGRMHDGDIALKTAICIPYTDSREELLSSPKTLRPVLQKIIKESEFTGKNVVTSMPSSDVRILSINYTSLNSKIDNESLLKALCDRVDEDLSEYVIDYLQVRTNDSDNEQLALVALVRRELVITYLELLRRSGLNVEALEIRPAAIKRLIFSLIEPDDYRNILVINFGRTKSYLTIISGRRLLLDQELNFGAKILIEKISSVLDMTEDAAVELILKHGFEVSSTSDSFQTSYTDEDISKTLLDIAKPVFSELIEEINRILIFAASENHGETISKIYLLGSISGWKGMDTYLEKKLKISFEVLNSPLKTFCKPISYINDELINSPHISIAAGLAMRGLITYE